MMNVKSVRMLLLVAVLGAAVAPVTVEAGRRGRRYHRGRGYGRRYHRGHGGDIALGVGGLLATTALVAAASSKDKGDTVIVSGDTRKMEERLEKLSEATAKDLKMLSEQIGKLGEAVAEQQKEQNERDEERDKREKKRQEELDKRLKKLEK